MAGERADAHEPSHLPVLWTQVMDGLRVRRDGRYLDGTFGRGGHKNQGRVVGPKFAFKNYGKCGKRVSDLFPNVDLPIVSITTTRPGSAGRA